MDKFSYAYLRLFNRRGQKHRNSNKPVSHKPMEDLYKKIRSLELDETDMTLIKPGSSKTSHPNRIDKREKDIKFIKALQEKEKRIRYYENAKHNLKMRDQFYRSTSQGKFCQTCWLMDYSCVCNKNKPVSTRHRYITFMHFKEYKRGTNTAIILPLTATDKTKAPLLIDGIIEDEEVLIKTLETANDNTFILFPSKESTTLQDYYESKIQGEKYKTYEEWVNNESLTIVVVDATWRQARCLTSRLPESIPRILLATPPSKSESNMRKQSEDGRITTAEALVYMFEELQESKDCVENMKSNLAERVKSMDWQCGRAGKIPRGKRRLEREAKNQSAQTPEIIADTINDKILLGENNPLLGKDESILDKTGKNGPTNK